MMPQNPHGYWLLALLFLASCVSNPPAPVIERTPPPKPAPPMAKPAPVPAKDWRPESYTVKKGDNLLRIGLEFGYDYKEIAVLNNIPPPYTIKIGQQLKLPTPNSNSQAVSEPTSSEDGVTVTPLKTESVEAGTSTATGSTGPVTLSEPKARRIPYSDAAYNTPDTKPVASAEPKPVSTEKPVTANPAEAKPVTPQSLQWAWPTQGKVIAAFNEANNKGIDIGGNLGQPVLAAAPGKVIYSGADLRGYGKLVIIKHDTQYLSVYAHNSKILIKEGQAVTAGQKIAEMGNTDSDKVKLHFEIRYQGKSIDPMKFLPDNAG